VTTDESEEGCGVDGGLVTTGESEEGCGVDGGLVITGESKGLAGSEEGGEEEDGPLVGEVEGGSVAETGSE